MSSTLSEGVRVPDIGSVNWGADVNFNWGLLNTALANISGNVKTDVANTWTATQTFSETISGSIDGVAARAVNDEDGNNIKTALAGKQSSLSQAQLDACNSGITAAAVQQIGTNASNISDLQTAVSSKAADDAVVHLAGAETISGNKTWTGYNTFKVTINIQDVAAVSAGGYGAGLNFFDYAGNRYGYIQPHVTSDGTKNLVFGNSASGYLEFASSPVPYANNIVNLGSSSNAWAAIYANALYANTSFAVRYANTTASAQSAISGYLSRGFGVISSDGKYFNRIFSAIAANYSRTTIETYLYDSNSDVLAQIKIQHAAEYNSSTGVTSLYVRPTVSGAVDLGIASNKWKSFNGINPGNLSIPNISTVVDISGSITSFDGTTIDLSSIITVPGWINIVIPYVAGDYIRFMLGRAGGSTAFNNSHYIICGSSDGDFISVFAPVSMGLWAQTKIKASGGAVTQARFYPCLGNV